MHLSFALIWSADAHVNVCSRVTIRSLLLVQQNGLVDRMKLCFSRFYFRTKQFYVSANLYVVLRAEESVLNLFFLWRMLCCFNTSEVRTDVISTPRLSQQN